MQKLFVACMQADAIANEPVNRHLNIMATHLEQIPDEQIPHTITKAINDPTQNSETISNIINNLPKKILQAIVYDQESLLATLTRILPEHRSKLVTEISQNSVLLALSTDFEGILKIAAICANYITAECLYVLAKTILQTMQTSSRQQAETLNKLCQILPAPYNHNLQLCAPTHAWEELSFELTRVTATYFENAGDQPWPQFIAPNQLTLSQPSITEQTTHVLPPENIISLLRHLPENKQATYLLRTISCYAKKHSQFIENVFYILTRISFPLKLLACCHLANIISEDKAFTARLNETNNIEAKRIRLYVNLKQYYDKLDSKNDEDLKTSIYELLTTNDPNTMTKNISTIEENSFDETVKEICRDFKSLVLDPYNEELQQETPYYFEGQYMVLSGKESKVDELAKKLQNMSNTLYMQQSHRQKLLIPEELYPKLSPYLRYACTSKLSKISLNDSWYYLVEVNLSAIAQSQAAYTPTFLRPAIQSTNRQPLDAAPNKSQQYHP